MGKIGDLIVRLQLKHEDYKKGLKEAKKETEGFGGAISRLKATALAAWAAIGAGVLRVANDIVNATNQMGDMWAQKMSAMKASYHSLISEMSAKAKEGNGWLLRLFNLSDTSAAHQMGANAKMAAKAAEEMTKAFDAEFELLNSVKLQKQDIQQELNELYSKMRDTTLSDSDRRAAAEKYKALLQPIADAEVATYSHMMEMAMKAWQAGTDLEREYSIEEMTEFFSKIGTEYDKMAEKFPDLMRVYETRKGDANNQLIFDIVEKYKQAANQISDVEKSLSRVSNSLRASLKSDLEAVEKAVAGIKKAALNDDLSQSLQQAIKEFDPDSVKFDELDYVYGIDLHFATDLDTSDIDEATQQVIDSVRREVEEVSALNGLLEQSFVDAFGGATQAITDALFGIEGAGADQILAALLQPFARTATQLGEMLIVQGLGIQAFKDSLKTLQPGVAIAAGAALMALGAALSSGIQALAGGGAGATSASTYNASDSSASSRGMETYQQDITVHVVGEISGDKIVLAGQKTLNKWNR